MQAIRVVLTASFLGLFGFVGLSANYGVPPSATSDLKKTEDQPIIIPTRLPQPCGFPNRRF
jgi:hypothetical protein